MTKQRTLLYGIFTSGVFLYLDQWLKWQSLHEWLSPVLVNSKLGWFPFLNDGVAFGLPVPLVSVIVISVPLILGMVYLLAREYRRGSSTALWEVAGLMAIITGAASNLIDRLVYHKTVDYILIFTGVINLADVIIMVGFVLLFFKLRKRPPTAT